MELETIDLRESLNIIWKRLFIIISIVVMSVGITGGMSYFVLEEEYEASTTLIVGKTNDPSSNYQLQYNDVMLYQELVKTYQEIAKSRAVTKEVIDDLKLNYSLEELRKRIAVSKVGDTQIISIKVIDNDSDRVSKITNKLVEVFKKQVAEIMQIESINIIDEATAPDLPIKPRPAINMAIAFVVSLMLGVGISFFLEYIDCTIKTPKDVERYLALSVIGEILEIPKS